jgi:DNA-binding GntR family transcriptional regulator
MRTDHIPDLFAADCLFHATLLDATGNLMMRQLQPIILTVVRISYEVGVFAVHGATVNRLGHLKVAEAVRDRDSDRARSDMARMLAHNREISLAYRTGGAPPA